MLFYVSLCLRTDIIWGVLVLLYHLCKYQSQSVSAVHDAPYRLAQKKVKFTLFLPPPPSSIIRTSYFYHTICHIRAKDTHKFIILSNSHMNYIYYTYACRFWFWVMMFDDDNNALRFRRNAEEKMIQILYHFISISPFYYIQK